jgi:hypothetical protein
MPACSAARAAAVAATRHRCAAQATVGLGRQAGRGEDRKQPPGTHVAVGATGRCVGIGHGPALVEDGVTGRTAEFVNGQVTDLLRLGSLRERHRRVSSSPHSPPPAYRARRNLGRVETRARQSAGSCAVRSAGHGSTGVLPGDGLGQKAAAPSGGARRWALALLGRRRALLGLGWVLGRVLFLVAQAVVEAAEQAAVFLGGLAAC